LQTVLFGLTGGLVPCSAAVTVLILCLNIGHVWLGIALVSAFSIGLAVTLVAVGVAAALGMRFVSRRATWVDRLVDRAPYISSVIIVLVGVAMIVSGVYHG
jgi:nickel/cobalt exporter